MALVDILCLASSRKYRGRCVAGLRTDGSGWVRPVSSEPYGTLHPEHYRLKGGTEPRLLDVLRVDLASHRPEPNQPENWLTGRSPWELRARPAGDEAVSLLAAAVQHGPDLFGTRGDRLTPEELASAPTSHSLTLAEPRRLRWQVRTTQAGNPQVRAIFEVAGQGYNLALTDPVWERFIAMFGAGVHAPATVGMPDESRLLLTISLGEPTDFDGACYKLVAAVITLPELWRV